MSSKPAWLIERIIKPKMRKVTVNCILNSTCDFSETRAQTKIFNIMRTKPTFGGTMVLYTLGTCKLARVVDKAVFEINRLPMSITNIKREFSTWVNSIGGGEVTEPFFDFIQLMGEAKSKQVLNLLQSSFSGFN